ncbi:Mut7-C ubiquitin/RNAse domain-containing protein [Oculatella sp. LEGE 06141]|uniref:Mut7-C RNAse domain-containing protein n=1 Tax=Oculatella sp. LEGE 06141 TaxID=1828648 RepID=UPI00187E8648|nr:Mut7-C RNAse domain-containing protein [Oculatella sp. LEGE 06141]MBE9177414.1 Mut7-C ubiquitin/RNAse domain-containing protein [Oculatella sp. LEGE 06141]
MFQAQFRFYAQLNDFLPPDRRGLPFQHSFKESASTKDMIEALGVPHPEVDLILRHGETVDFSYLVHDGDRFSVYPTFQSIDIGTTSRVRPQPLPHLRFVLDIHLGKLATHLRLLGFDTAYRNDFADEALAQCAHEQQRILLTRDRGLLKRSLVTHGYCLRSTDPWEQLIEVLHRFDGLEKIAPFQRCLRCNGLLEAVDKAVVCDRLPPKTRQYYDEFHRCQTCHQLYWKGAHFERMQAFVNRIQQ